MTEGRRMTDDLVHQVLARLERVLDPCSCMTDHPVSIVDLGLVESIEVDDGRVDVELVATSPMCLYMADIVDEATAEVSTLDGVDEVQVTQNVRTLWRPERMDPALRERKRKRYGARPWDGSNAV